MDNAGLITLCSRTWSLTALRLMAEGVPGRTSPLASAAGCGRTAMQASVMHLVALGLLEKAPGHGHPLRAGYRLTAAGMRVAQWSVGLNGIVSPAVGKLVLHSKWALPVISCLPRETRYGELRRDLAPITDRALSRCLSGLAAGRLVSRAVSSKVSPPAVSYRLSAAGDRIHGHVHVLYRNAA